MNLILVEGRGTSPSGAARRRRFQIQAVAVLASWLSAAGMAHAVVLIDQDFDDAGVFVAGSQLVSPGVGDSSTTAGLWRNGLGTPGGTVQTSQFYSGSQSISSIRTTFGVGQVLGYVDNSRGATSGVAEASFRFRRGTDGTDNTTGASFRLGYHADIAVFDNIEACGVDINKDGTANVVNDGNPVPILSGIDTSSWHAFKLIVDIGAKTYDVFYSADGTDAGFTQVYDGAIIDNNTLFSPGGSLNCMWWGPHGNGGTVFYDDAFLSAQIPEPTSAVLVAAAGMGLLVRARRKPA